jgi:hypothetical protein
VSGNERFGVMGDNACNARACGLFLHNYCPRMILAVKGSSAMMKRIMPLTAPGHSLTTFSWEEEKAALIRPKAYTSRFQVSPIPPNVLPPLIPSVHGPRSQCEVILAWRLNTARFRKRLSSSDAEVDPLQ